MSCSFGLCEFYNVVLGGLVIGVVTSFIFVWLTRILQKYSFYRRYRHLKSLKGKFDWDGYAMQKEDGRRRENCSNGSKIRISIDGGMLFLELQHSAKKNKIEGGTIGEVSGQKEGGGENDTDVNGSESVIRKWKGKLIMQHDDFGVLFFKYQDVHEYGKRECVIGFYKDDSGESTYDYIFMTPLDDRIWFLEQENNGSKMHPRYHYDSEIFIRKREARARY